MQNIKKSILNSKYFLNSSKVFKKRVDDPIIILLLITSMEHIIIARDELHAFIQETSTNKELLKSHKYKLNKTRAYIEQIEIITDNDTQTRKAKSTKYNQIKLSKLLNICRYGLNGQSSTIETIFKKSSWHYNEFKNEIITKINSIESLINAIEKSNNNVSTFSTSS